MCPKRFRECGQAGYETATDTFEDLLTGNGSETDQKENRRGQKKGKLFPKETSSFLACLRQDNRGSPAHLLPSMDPLPSPLTTLPSPLATFHSTLQFSLVTLSLIVLHFKKSFIFTNQLEYGCWILVSHLVTRLYLQIQI